MAGPSSGFPVEVCEHGKPPRRVCDVCGAPPFLACSAACLAQHQATAHAGADATDAATRAASFQVALNRNVEASPERYAGQREQLMTLVAEATATGRTDASRDARRSIGILGAGNCADVDPERLAREFGEVHLVDIDDEALARGRESFPDSVRGRIFLHGGIDLSGLLPRIDEWGDRFPDDAQLARASVEAIHAVLANIGRRFDVVLSACVLSQLPLAFRRTWVASRTSWDRLTAALTAVHLATVAGAVEPGGAGILAFDVFGAKTAPGLRGFDARDSAGLRAYVDREIASGAIRPDWDPAVLAARLGSPRMSGRVEGLALRGPWLWSTGDTLLVYALTWNAPRSPPA